jgi:hypothetical protein
MMRILRLTIILLCCAAALAACGGPRPLVTRQELRPPAAPSEPYLLSVTVQNQGGGEGEAEVVARLLRKDTGETAAQEHELVMLEPHEAVQVVLELRPDAPGQFDVAVEAQYPPQ